VADFSSTRALCLIRLAAPASHPIPAVANPFRDPPSPFSPRQPPADFMGFPSVKAKTGAEDDNDVCVVVGMYS
jgi:hypothetical protein